MFDWVWIQLWRVFFLKIPRKLTCGNSFCKVASNKTLISMQKNSTREKIWRKTLLQLSGNGRLLWLFPENFHKTSIESHCDCRQTRSEQISTSVNVLKHCIITKDISRWNEITLKKYIEMRLHRKETAKQLLYLKISIRGTKATTIFCLFKKNKRSTLKLRQFFMH